MLENVPVIGGGQATRTWVSGVGDDANPCSRTAPCKTFAGAISKTAAGGEIDALDPGGFGSITITKSITIDGAAGNLAGILAAGANGVIVNAGVNDVVTLRNLSINGAGTGINGIRFLAGALVVVDHCVIFNFSQKGISFEPSGTSRLVVIDSIIRNCNNASNGGAVSIRPQNPSGIGNALLDNVRLERNLFGVSNTDRSVVSVRNSLITSCTTFGVNATSAAGGLTVINLDNCMLTANAANASTTAVASVGGNAAVRLTNCTVLDNSIGLSSTNGGFLVTWGNNRIAHNAVNGAPNLSQPLV